MVHIGPVNILVVEDDVLIRELAVGVLSEAGFNVTEAGHADQALRILQAKARKFRVVFSDVQMPGRIDGVGLALHVGTCWPWIGLLLTSGKPVPRLEGIFPAIRFLRKPYVLNEVIGRIHEIAAASLKRPTERWNAEKSQ